jgi:L-amino acid N-acyltransferase
MADSWSFAMPPTPPVIRLATADDLPAINAIYNHYVLHSTCTYQLEPTPDPERRQWFDAHGSRLPVTVVLSPDGAVVGWASLSTFIGRPAYRFTVENSVYVRHDLLRQGIGRALLADLLRRSDELGYRNVLAVISADQEPSMALHLGMGFVEVGRLLRVGYKFDRWLDVAFLQREHT